MDSEAGMIGGCRELTTIERVNRWRLRLTASVRGTLALVVVLSATMPIKFARADPLKVAGEIRDMLLMLDNGPLHVRVHVFIEKHSPSDARQVAIDRLMKSLDSDNDGKLSREEAQRSPLFREKQRPGAEKFIRTLGADLTVSRRDVAQRIERLGGETVIYRQNTAASDTDNEVFKLLDRDSDHLVSEAEMFDAVDRILAKDADDDECVTLDEFAPPAATTSNIGLVPAPQPVSAAITVANLIRDTRQTLLPAQLLQKYDKDRNRSLSAVELGWIAEKVRSCDGDRDGELNLRELARLHETPADIELEVDVVRTPGQPMIRLIRAAGQRMDGDKYPDLATVKLPSAIISFSTREVDPFAESMALALRTFNELDVDSNGYLDRDESKLRERFARGLFDQMDVDSDGKIFGEEMKEFIRSRGEPVATTCHVTAFDDGAGFFGTLDANGDRRISIREMRYADKTLTMMQQDQQPGLGENEPARRYRIEFERGIFNPFGTASRAGNQQQLVTATTTKPREIGPTWFQRWDRNNDGDLTWREFLGPRDAFEQLDADSDDLIDPKEAEQIIRGVQLSGGME